MRKIKESEREDRKRNRRIFIYLIVITIIFIFLNLILIFLQTSEKETTSEKDVVSERIYASEMNATTVRMRIPAVDKDGNGVVTTLVVEVTKGYGRTLVDIDDLLFWADTQHSIRMARLVADNITGKDLNDYDIVYAIEANASIIGGPSAGAALTIATLAAIEGKKLREDVMLTGTINHDGTIGPVSEILEKAKASKDVGATLFLVPLLQSKDVKYERNKHCEKFGVAEICSEEIRPKRVDIGKETGIDVKEVESVQEAIKYFT